MRVRHFGLALAALLVAVGVGPAHAGCPEGDPNWYELPEYDGGDAAAWITGSWRSIGHVGESGRLERIPVRWSAHKVFFGDGAFMHSVDRLEVSGTWRVAQDRRLHLVSPSFHVSFPSRIVMIAEDCLALRNGAASASIWVREGAGIMAARHRTAEADLDEEDLIPLPDLSVLKDAPPKKSDE